MTNRNLDARSRGSQTAVRSRRENVGYAPKKVAALPASRLASTSFLRVGKSLRAAFHVGVAALACAAPLVAAEPRVLLDGCRVEKIAGAPDVVTPIGVTFDAAGRLLVVESHTHQRPEGYAGPPADRIRMLADSDGDGRLDRWTTWAEGFQQAMSVLARPDGRAYVVTRRDVRLLADADGDGAADSDAVILRLETTGDYPHNGLSGIFLDQHAPGGGRLYLGVGENLGVDYTIVGSDGRRIANTGGVGVVYQCRPDGSQLERVAIGFWNPFGVCAAAGRLYAIDNDPDASPPCRLVEVVRGGDYGFRFEFGRAGTHPLLAWDGELPGTLPMICGVGEAPTALVAHRGSLWVTSWGDHRIERYELAPDGVRLAARLTTVVQGDADFRPTGMAVAPDGSLYFADWVKRDYPVHGHGRLWRLTVPQNDHAALPTAGQTRGLTTARYRTDPMARHRLVESLLDQSDSVARETFDAADAQLRLAALTAIRFRPPADRAELESLARRALGDADAEIRLFAVRWIAEERLAELRDDVARLLDGEIPDERYYLAVLAALDWLDGDHTMRDDKIADHLLVRELKNPARPAALRALALRLLSPDCHWLTLDRLRPLLDSPDAAVQLEAVRTLAGRTDPERPALLAEIARRADGPAELRAEAVAALGGDAGTHGELLAELAKGSESIVAREAQRVLRLTAGGAGTTAVATTGDHPAADLSVRVEPLLTGGDPASGRRLFFAPVGPRCAVCHRRHGRGGRIGPDLTRIGAQQTRRRIVESILEPSREIAPHFQAWQLVTADGLTRVGLRLPEGGDDGLEDYADPAGARFTLASDAIAERSPSDKSIMPDGLDRTLTPDDLRDLAAFLASPEQEPPRSPSTPRENQKVGTADKR